MRIKIFLKKIVSIGVMVILAITLVGCFDLGDFNDESAYYSAFGNIKMVYQTDEKKVENKDYSVKDYFYNKNTGKNFTYGDPEDKESDKGKDIPQLLYVYMVIPVEQNLSIDSMSLYFNALQTCSLDIWLYAVDKLPDGGTFTGIRLLGDPEYQQKLENGEPIKELIKYSDPSDDLVVAKTTLRVKEGEWNSFTVDNWKGGDTLDIKKGEYLLLRFINNRGINTEENPPVKFRVTNLLIRAFS